jgi:hypothetical protein
VFSWPEQFAGLTTPRIDGGKALSAQGTPMMAPSPTLHSLSNAELLTSIPAAVAFHPSQIQVAGATASGRLIVFQPK